MSAWTGRFEKCKARRDEVEGIYRLKHAVHVAAQGGDPQDSIAHLRGRVTSDMETARSAARQGGAWGGDVARELRIASLWYKHGQRQRTGTQRPPVQPVRVSANYSIKCSMRAKQVVCIRRRGREHARGGLSRARELCKFIEEIGEWIDISARRKPP